MVRGGWVQNLSVQDGGAKMLVCMHAELMQCWALERRSRPPCNDADCRKRQGKKGPRRKELTLMKGIKVDARRDNRADKKGRRTTTSEREEP